jgi:FG-GAP-like repeat
VKTGGKGTTDVVLGDFDNDTFLDIAAANLSSGNVSFLRNAGAGVFSVAPQLFKTGTRPSALAVADYNNDGNLDLAISHSVSRFVGILIGNGTPATTFKPVLQVNTSREHLPRSIAAGDFNGDGRIDLAMGPTVGGKLRVILGVGNGDFSLPYEFDLGNKAVRLVTNIALADVNLDGQLDILTANTSSNDVSVLLRKV